jgi:leucyl-tRNA synthetase
MEGTRSEVEIPVEDGRLSVTLFTPGDVLHQNSALALRADHPLAKYLSGEQTGEAEKITRQKTRRTERTGVKRKVRVRLRIEDHESPVYLAPPGDFPVDIDMMRIAAAVNDSAETACIYGNEKDIRPSVTYRIRDWAVSRNRVWGTPIPMVECENCGTGPVDMSELPIRAKAHSGGRTARCGSCHTSQPLVPLVLDCFFDDSWCFYGASLNQALNQAPGNSPEKTFENNPFTEWQRRPASRVHFHAGFDTFVYFHIFRFMGHVLFDLGYTPRPEPIDFFHGHDVVKIDGKKMSKRHGNAPDLDQLIRECGCDVIRLSVLTNSNPGKPMSWSEDRLQHGRAVVETLVDLIASEKTSWNGPIDGQQTGANQKHLTDINAELTRVDELIGLYRIGAALDLLYKATRKMLRYRQTADESAWRETYDEMISWWKIFAPETVESKTDSTKGARITRLREHPRRS